MAEPTPTVRGDTPSDHLVSTKLRVPPLPPQHVGRAHLNARLLQARERSLTLIAAPAGFGKTSLLSAWLREAPVSAAWVSLDSGDDDFARFWAYALAAFDGLQPEDAQAGRVCST